MPGLNNKKLSWPIRIGLCACPLMLIAVLAKGGPLNDTGITFGGDYPKGVQPDCTASWQGQAKQQKDFLTQQDCATGSNASAADPDKVLFQYRKIGSDGELLVDNANEWSCVLDTVTGLMWEVKNRRAESNLHHVGDQFTWYHSNPKRNGGNIGQWNAQSATCHGYQAGQPRSYCHVEQFASRVNEQGLCGFDDWRVPTRHELTSLVHFGVVQPAIDLGHFPNTLNTFYWTHNPVPARPIEAWTVDFEFGTTSPMRKTDLRPVRLVRDAGE